MYRAGGVLQRAEGRPDTFCCGEFIFWLGSAPPPLKKKELQAGHVSARAGMLPDPFRTVQETLPEDTQKTHGSPKIGVPFLGAPFKGILFYLG